MNLSSRFDADRDSSFQALWGDGERVFCRGWRLDRNGQRQAVLAVRLAAEHPTPASLDRLAHEYGLKDELDPAWAARPLELLSDAGRPMLVLEDPGGEPLEGLLGAPMEVGRFLRLAVAITAALNQVHRRGLVHKDIKPAHILANVSAGEARLTGFGIASRLPRERQAPEPPETIVGTLAYMAPEQTGRMNRWIDARSDLYALGVTLYQMLTGTLPFTAADPMEWVHCHIARRPVPPAERLADLPAAVSAIIMKLLAKTAEERYQTAGGVERDLRRCLAQWEARRRTDDFPLGEHDTPDRLLIPEKLYGRERELESLRAAFDRIVKIGTPELVLVSGYAGIGKSAVVHELHKALVPPRGLFASGKFDQYKRDIPFSTLAQAFQGLIRGLLAKSEAGLAPWRDALLEVLGPNGRLMVDLVPELKLIIGDLPPLPELPPQQSQSRFQLVFRRFLGVFARPDHPLALFLDDLQWLDAATLDLLEDWLTHPDVRHLLLIGAYRDNEIDATHPLRRKLEAIRKAGALVQEIVLAPLGLGDVGRLITDALHGERDEAEPLARLVHEKTAGNPFFTIQFLATLAEEGLLAFDHGEARWSWDLERIEGKGFTDNVLELMLAKLGRLPEATQMALRQLACLGNGAAVATLALVRGGSEEALDSALWEAVRAGLVFRQEGTYWFLHDRVQEAAYALIPEGERAAEHLRSGRQLAAGTPLETIEESIFEIVSQLNRGAALITAAEEREQLAELNLLAGRRARASTAYASALTYLTAGVALLPDDAWERRPELAFALELHRAECEFLTGALREAEARLAELASRATNVPDLATVTRLRVDLFMTLGRSDCAVAVGLDYLHRVRIAWSAHPTPEEVRQEYARMWRQLGDRPIEALLDLPRMTDPVACGTMDVLTALVSPALFTDENLRCLVIGRMVNLSLEHGNSDASCYAYTSVGTVLGPYFGDYKVGFRFGQLGLDLVEQRGMDRLKARVYLAFGNLASPSMRHLRTGRPLARHAFDTALQVGDLTYAAFSCNGLITQLLATGDPLAEVQREAEAGLDFARQARFGLVVNLITAQLQLIRTLRGLTPAFGCFDDAGCDEERFEQQLVADPRLAIAACLYWIRKLQARLLADDHAAAAAAATKAESLLWMSPSIFERAEYHFYAALVLAVLCDAASAAESTQYRQALASHHHQLQEWADNCPENFENRAALVGAENARIDGRELEAMRLYEQAIHSARANGFVHNEAIAYERASAFYRARGFDQIATLYLRNARHCYLRWGADGKVRQLDEFYPHLREDEPAPSPTRTIGAPVEYLDLTTVITVSQAVSGEIVLEKLLDTLLRTALAQAGAERGLLILSRGAEPRIAAEATTRGDTVVVHLRDEPVTPAALPESVLRYVLRTRESVILDDAAAQPPFAADPYIWQRQARSILCLPLIRQAKLIGVLYLENNLASRVFAPARLAVLKLLASQAAIALENARLYHDLAEREAKIQRLVDANIIGVVISEPEGQVIETNDAFLDMLGYTRDDLAAGPLRWTDLTPTAWRAASQRAMAQIRTTGACEVFEKEYVRKDGSRVPVLIGAAALEGTGETVAFVLDLTERKRAEEALRESEERFRTLVQFSFDVYWETDTQHRFIRQEFAEGLDDAPAPVSEIGKTRWEVPYLEPDAEAWRKHRETLDAHLPFRDFELARPTPDGGKRYVSVSGLPVFDKSGRFIGYRGVGRHITERKRAEEALRRSEAYLAEAQRLSHTGTFAFNATAPLYWSEESYRIWGLDPLQGLPNRETVLQRIHPDDRERIDVETEEALRQRRDFALEFRIVLPDGTVKYIESTGQPLFSADGELLEMVATHVDVTERKRAQEEHERLRQLESDLAHVNRMSIMGELAASLAHEILHPIATSRNNARAGMRFLEMSPPNLSEVKEALSCIVRDADRAKDIVGRMRDHIKKAPPRREAFDLNEALREVIATVRSAIDQHRVSVRTRLMDGLSAVQGDRVQLQQVVLNLVLNSVEAMSSVEEGARELSITTKQLETSDILVAVQDSGPGIDLEHLEQVFAPFYTTKTSGMGMGLSICRSIIAAHGGRLWAEANRPRGATFQFTLPADLDDS